MKALVLTSLLCGGAISLNAADISPLEAARYKWSMTADCASEFTVNGAVELGVPADNGRTAARFDGGRLVRKDSSSLLKGLDSFTLYLRVKPEGKYLSGTVLCQRDPGRHQSGAFDVVGWHMAFIERQHLAFHGMIKGGLPPMAAAYFSSVNMDQNKYPASGWRDIVVSKQNGGPLRFYFDGKLVAERSKASIIPGGFNWAFDGKASPLTIGADADGNDPFVGWIDQVALWDRALDGTELSQLAGGKAIVNAVIPQPAARAHDEGVPGGIARIFGTGILTADTPVVKRYDWVDAKLPAFRDQLEKTDTHYPRYHLTLPGEQWNPIAFFHGGKYHVFFGWTTAGCFGYFDDARENIVWQHIMSEDLIHWKILPMPIRSPLWPNENGTFFVNDKGEVVVLYFGDRGSEPRMAVSRDPDLVNWEAFPELVKFHNIPKEYQFRHDPSAVFKKGDDWHLVATTVRPSAKAAGLPLYKSKDLVNWDFAGEFFSDATGRPINECGQLFPLGDKMVFTAIHDLSKGEQYITGTVRADGTFAKQFGGVADFNSRSYNCVTTAVNDQRRATMWRFMNIVRPFRQASAAGWWNTYGGPRDLRLDEQGRLLVRPSPSLEKLRAKHLHHVVESGTAGKIITLEDFRAASSEVQITFQAGDGGDTGIRLTDGTTSLEARYDHAAGEVQLDLTGMRGKNPASTLEDVEDRSGSRLRANRASLLRAPLPVKRGQAVALRLFSDRSVFEVFANDEIVISAVVFFQNPGILKVSILDSRGSKTPITVEAWEMQPLKWSSSSLQ
jgi:beta-fructofuranosidase